MTLFYPLDLDFASDLLSALFTMNLNLQTGLSTWVEFYTW